MNDLIMIDQNVDIIKSKMIVDLQFIQTSIINF